MNIEFIKIDKPMGDDLPSISLMVQHRNISIRVDIPISHTDLERLELAMRQVVAAKETE